MEYVAQPIDGLTVLPCESQGEMGNAVCVKRTILRRGGRTQEDLAWRGMKQNPLVVPRGKRES